MSTPSNRTQLQNVLTKPDITPTSQANIMPKTQSIVDLDTYSATNPEATYELPLVRNKEPPAGKYAFLCVYTMKLSPSPFIRYMLYKYDDPKGTMTFPIVQRNHSGGSSLLQTADALFQKCCEPPKGNDNRCKGFIEHEENVYLFYEYAHSIPVQTIESKHQLWWVLLTEICNDRMVITFPVDSSVYSLFYHNQDLCRIRNRRGELCSQPIALYYGGPKDSLAYAAVFGVQQSDPSAPFGPFYYFNPFIRASRFALWSYKRSSQQIGTKKQRFPGRGGPWIKPDTLEGGVVRFAVFIGDTEDTMFVLGHPSERQDKSEYTITTEKKFDPPKGLTKEDTEKRARLSDRDALWAADYSSIFKGPIRTSHGDIMLWEFLPKHKQNSYATYAIKDFRQQVSLSVHQVDPENAGESWEANGNYKIL